LGKKVKSEGRIRGKKREEQDPYILIMKIGGLNLNQSKEEGMKGEENRGRETYNLSHKR